MDTSDYQNSSKCKPSDHQLVINSSSSKLKITFINETSPPPSGNLPVVSIYFFIQIKV